jgi:hypothetical protein
LLLRGPGDQEGYGTVSPLARACASAYDLIEAKIVKRTDLTKLGLQQAVELLERAAAHLKALPDNEAAREAFAAGVKKTIDEVTGQAATKVAQKDIRDKVDKNTGRVRPKGSTVGTPKPLFTKFAKRLRKAMKTALLSDTMADWLSKLEEATPHVTLREDRELIDDIIHELGKVEDRAREWRTKRLVFKKVTPLRAIEKRKE